MSELPEQVRDRLPRQAQLGIYPQIGAILLIGVMLGAIHRKIFVWQTGFWGENGRAAITISSIWSATW